MASMQPTSLSRTRSLRAPAAVPGRSIVPVCIDKTNLLTSETTTTALTQPLKGLVVTPNIDQFLANLRLLNLDLDPDWPHITQLTFTCPDSDGGQKQRIRCVEWALYQLLVLWDPVEARAKLQHLFPATNQKESVILRGALLRCLEQIKKTGALGRQILLRKGLLDECKGERLEEVLAIFSAAVLRKVEDGKRMPGHLMRQVTEESPTPNQRAQLDPLILAYTVSLRRKLQNREKRAARLDEFANALRLENSQIDRRRQFVDQPLELNSEVSREAMDHVLKAVSGKPSSQSAWRDALITGDSHAIGAGLHATPFDEVWDNVCAGGLHDVRARNRDFLEELDARMEKQQTRLAKWQAFHRDLISDTKKLPSKPGSKAAASKGIDLGFQGHQSIRQDRRGGERAVARSPQPESEYSYLLQDFQAELLQVKTDTGTSRHDQVLDLQPALTRHVLSEVEDEPPEATRAERSRSRLSSRRNAGNLHTGWTSPRRVSRSESPLGDEKNEHTLPSSPTSPPKSRYVLSLAERTRLSMARTLDREDSDSLVMFQPMRRRRTASRSPEKNVATPTADRDELIATDDEPNDLVARTRRSMANFEASRHNAKLQRQRSERRQARESRHNGEISRHNYFAPMDEQAEETTDAEGESSTMPASEDTLPQDGDDYESVFRSRPKIKMSWDVN